MLTHLHSEQFNSYNDKIMEKFDQVLDIVRDVSKLGMEVCVTLGELGADEATDLKEAGVTALLVACGPITAIPLVLFSWAARRIPFSSFGFIQFIAPTMTFFMGVEEGESLTPLRIASFACIWGGAAVFAFGAWRRARALRE